MKKIIILFLIVILILPNGAYSQNVGIGTNTPNSNAILHLESDNKGLLLPNIGSIYRTGMPSPPSGLLLYDFNTKSLWMRGATDWQEIQTFSNSQWTETSGNVYRLTGRVGIGISNPLARLHVKDSSVIFTAPTVAIEPIGFSVPISGAGTRMMWLPEKSAFRAGTIENSQWDAANIGTWSFASGFNTRAFGNYSTAMGFAAYADGNYSTALGVNTTASGSASTALGNNTIASGYSSTTMGFDTRAEGDNSTAMGSGTYSIGKNSTAMGRFTIASGDFATSMGNETYSKGYASLTIGRFNDSINSASRTTWVAADPLFILGNGTADNARHNAMVVYKSGNMVLKNPTSVTSDPGVLPIPISGAGTRMMWLPEKSAFRAGTVFNDGFTTVDESTNWDADSVGTWSFASGINSKAKGVISTAMGGNTQASGDYSTAMGVSTVASNQFSTAMGFGTIANGLGSVAIGVSTRALGSYSTAMGYKTTSSGPSSTSMGDSTIASGFATTAMGYSTTASGSYSTTLGALTKANGNNTTAMGLETVAKAYASLAMGRYNDSINSSNKTLWVATDPLLILGNGTSDVARSNAMVVYKNGNTDLNGKVNVNYLSDINNAQLNLIENNGAEFAHLAFFNKNGVNNLTDKWLMRAYPLGTNASRRINFYTNGGANGGDILTIFGNGNATLAGILTQLSDARLKKNIRPLLNVLPQLNAINAYHYQWSEDGRDSTWQIGVLAQEVQQVFPELVMKDEKGNLSVNYSGLIPVLLASVKEQQAQIEQLKKQQEEIIRLLKQK